MDTQKKSTSDTADDLSPPLKYKWGDIKEEDITRITDCNGTVHDVLNVDGDCYSVELANRGFMPDPRVMLPEVLDMEIHQDDIFICAYPKSGTHWVWEIATMLTKKCADYDQLPKESFMLEFHMPEEFNNMAPPRVFNTHIDFRQLPRQIIQKKCKIVFIQRNPKDVAVSQFCHRQNIKEYSKTDWEKFLNVFETESDCMTKWFSYTLDWEKIISENKDLPLLSLYYEEIKVNPIQEIKKLARFLDVNCDESLAAQIADRCDFAKLKKANNEIKIDVFAPGDGKPSSNRVNKTDFLYRKGVVGDWKNWFTVAQNERFDSSYNQWMKTSRLEFIYDATK